MHLAKWVKWKHLSANIFEKLETIIYLCCNLMNSLWNNTKQCYWQLKVGWNSWTLDKSIPWKMNINIRVENKTPFASIRRIVQLDKNIYKIKPGFMFLRSFRMNGSEGIFVENEKNTDSKESYSITLLPRIIIRNW